MQLFVKLSNVFKELRWTAWDKSLVTFLALLWVPHEWPQYISLIIAAAMAFNLTSSIVYIINDFKDIGYDRVHPTKKNRPLASGALSPLEAYALLLILSGIVLVLVGLMSNPWVSLVLLVYLAANLLYTYGVKHVAYLDLLFIAAFMGLRTSIGFLVIGVPIVWYLVGAVMAFNLFTMTAYRLAEVSTDSPETRPSLKQYSLKTLRFLLTVFLMVSVISYYFAVSVLAMPLVYTDVLYFFTLLVIHDYILASKSLKEIGDEGLRFFVHHRQALTLTVLLVLTLLVLFMLFYR